MCDKTEMELYLHYISRYIQLDFLPLNVEVSVVTYTVCYKKTDNII